MASGDCTSDHDHPPRAVGGVHLLRRIGDGAMSDVYLGYDTARGRHVAVKLLADRLAGDPGSVRRFTREGRLSRTLAHPALVRGLAGGVDPGSGRHYLTLEYVDGPSALGALARHGPFALPAVARLAADVGTALRHLHGRSLIHRDVKPDNILLAPDGSAKLADLGLARRVRPGEPGEPTPAAAGTPHYMPPEQVVDCDRVDPRSDLYALGVTLYHLLTGRVPFDGDSQDQLLQQKLAGRFPPARLLRPDLPAGADRLLARLLAADPVARFQTAGEFLAAVPSHLGPPAPLRAVPEANGVAEHPPAGDGPADENTARTSVDIPALPPAPRRHTTGVVLLGVVLTAGVTARWSLAPPPPPGPARSLDPQQVRAPASHPKPLPLPQG